MHSVSVRNLCWKYNFVANFGVLSLEFDVKALLPQGLTGSPIYFGLLNNLMTLINCESLREIGEMAYVSRLPGPLLDRLLIEQMNKG